MEKNKNTEIQHFTDAPEIQHFAVEKVNKNDNVYGVAWGNAVREYLKTAYSDENAKAEIVSFGTTYKILKRENVTAFYDADGNTLFDVENARLEKEYALVMKEDDGSPHGDCDEPVTPMGKTIAAIERRAFENAVSEESREVTEKTEKQGTPEEVKEQARKKLEGELDKAKNKMFADPVIKYLLERCEDDASLSEDVLQGHKTWAKCMDYIYGQAKKQADGNRCAVRDDVVYEWAEDYFHLDDKAIEEQKARDEEERRKKLKKTAIEAGKSKKSKTDKGKDKPAAKKAEEKPAKRKTKEMDGQMDLFSIMGL